MQKLFAKALLAGIGTMAGFGFAVAADPVEEEPLIPQAPATPIDTSQWGGLYIGVYGGYSWFSADGATATGNEVDGDGGKIGAYTGYNWQFENNVVTGLEALGGYSATDGSSANVTVEQEWEASLRARLGYAFDQSVIYSFAGLAMTSVDAQALTGADSQTLGGYTVGAGWETQFSNNFTARIEYGFSDYQEDNYNLGNPTNNGIDFQDQTINLGVGFRY